MSRTRSSGLPALAFAVLVAIAACSNAAGPSPSAGASASALADPATPTPQPSPTAFPTFTPWPTTASSTPGPSAKPVSGTWVYDVYDARAVRWQNPDMTACTAASALMMLNMATYWQNYAPASGAVPAASKPNTWTPDVSYARQESILAYQRKTGTMLLSWPGADAHGWRDSLNYDGWGSIKAGVYTDQSFTSFDAAAKATVMAIALYRKPVGILGWAGNHAQIVTGYRVKGGDPRTGATNFTIVGVYVTDPLKGDGFRDRYFTIATWKSGAKTIKFTPYTMTNSPYVDSIDGHQGNAEWDGKWVTVAPVK
jgi:hypothetical protein